jgi:hypothetical protein
MLKTVTAKHTVTIPFIRMLPGPMDFTPGAMTDEKARDFDVNLSFLEPGTYTMTLFTDAPDADKNAEHYEKLVKKVTAKDTIKIKLAPAGGAAAKFKK